MPDSTPRALRPDLEALEAREVPAATPWLVESFQRGPVKGLPAGWSDSASSGAARFQVDTHSGLGDKGLLESDTGSAAGARAWLSAPFARDVEASAALLLNSSAPARLFIRGQNLTTSAPSYYAVELSNAGKLKLVELNKGKEGVLGSVAAPAGLANRWVTVTVKAEGSAISVSLYRGDTNQYLGADGKWTRQPASALKVTDATLAAGGQVGFSRGAGVGSVAFDSLRVAPGAAEPDVLPLVEERFARPGPNTPPGWAKWSAGTSSATTASDETLRLSGGNGTAARVWLDKRLANDSQVSSSVYLDGTSPAGVFARGSNLDTDRPNYYGLEVTRGVRAELVRVVNGARTSLGEVKSDEWVSGSWVQASLVLNGDQLRAQVFRSDTGQYLREDGSWGLTPAWVLTARDSQIRTGGNAGLTRGAGPGGSLTFDNFLVTTSPDRSSKPAAIPTGLDKPSAVKPPKEDLPPAKPGKPTPAPSRPPVPTPTPPAPTKPPVATPAPKPSRPVPAVPANPALPAVPRHHAHIRLANLAYYGTPMTATETTLLRNSVDLVVPNLTYLDDIQRASPGTPQFVYTNVSNVYLGLVTDWNDYADRNRLDRESAFFHAAHATKFAGASASSVPVERFWGVFRGDGKVWDDLTRDSQHTGNDFAFADKGKSVALGYPEKFRELNVDLSRNPGPGWTGSLEYVSAVDAQGNPTRWSNLKVGSDTTGGFKRDGKVVFDAPRDWKAASVGGSARLYFVRVVSGGAGAAPHAAKVLGADYSKGNVIPAFDKSADRDGDGYLSDAEYARRKKGFDARFEYQSRITYPNYGAWRFATNVGDPGFRAWAADYHARFLAQTPLADGFFVDNSIGRLAIDPATIKEDFSSYSADYGSLLGAVNKRLGSKWLIANTAGGNTTAEPIVRNGVSYLEEYALRPVSANHVQFDDLVATLNYRREISGGKAYEILDTLPTQNIDANDARMQMSSLAMYYAVADANLSFLMLNGGNEPASSWSRHYFKAVETNVGKPKGGPTEFATGQDPAARNLVYKVYQREYTNALVLYKPLSYTRGTSGGVGANTATTHTLSGSYRVLRPDGTLSSPVRSVTLKNGEGAVLIKA